MKGRLEQVRGFGRRRAEIVRTALGEMLARVRRGSLRRNEEPGVDLLLDIDRETREKAAAGKLIKIAPKCFNPSHLLRPRQFCQPQADDVARDIGSSWLTRH